MDLFDQIEKIANDLSEAARKIILAELESRRLGIPGKASWNGYDANGQATVFKNNKIINVSTTSTINLPLGSEVYVDETFTVEYKSNSPVTKEPSKTQKGPKIKERVKKARRPTLPGPSVVEDVRGATWLVYHEYLKELEWKTEAQTGTNPKFDGYSLFLGLIGLAILGGGALLGVIYWTLFEFKVETVPSITINDLPKPDNHPDIPEADDITSDDYNYFFLMQGVVDQLFTSSGILAFPPAQADGFWLGKNNAVGNYIFFIGSTNQAAYDIGTTSGGLTFSDKYFIRPWEWSATDKLSGLLTHFGPGKVQAALYRVVGVYPSKKFKINVHAWPTPDFEIPKYNPEWTDLEKQQWEGNLPEMRHTQFVIPDDIPEWNTILGDGLTDADNTTSDLIPYEIIPLHDWLTYGGENEPYDLTKFASYSQNNLFLNYIVKSHAPWTGLGDTYRTNYHLLSLRFTSSEDDDSIVSSYRFTISTFTLPEEIRFENNIIAEDPNFPLQGGERNIAERQVTFTIKGTNDPIQQPDPLIILAVRGDTEKDGFLPGSDPDSSSAGTEGGITYYSTESHLTYSVLSPIPGFVYNPYTGQYIFNQNNAAYASLGIGQTREELMEYTVQDKSGFTVYNTITIQIQGSSSSFVAEDPPAPEAEEISLVDSDDDPAPTHEWDPEPYIESLETGDTQVFEKVTVEIPFPEEDSGGNVLGWQGRVAKFQLEEVEPPVIRIKYPSGKSVVDSSYDPADFIFSVTTNGDNYGTSASKFIVDFTPKPRNYDFLKEGGELNVTYTLRGLVNNAPFVGNFETVFPAQEKKVKSDMVAFAFSDDWRSRIWNPREDPAFNNIFTFPTGDSVTRDTNIPVINIDPISRAVSSNFISEFDMINPSGEDPSSRVPVEGDVYITRGLVYEFDESTEELLFYASDDTTQSSPLDWDSVMSILQSNGQAVAKTDYFNSLMLPSGFDRNDETGKKWRWNETHSAMGKGYIIYGFIPV